MKMLAQMNEYLLELPFLAVLIRTLVLGMGIGEAVVLVALIAGMAYKSFTNRRVIEENESFAKELEDLKSKINGLSAVNGLRRTNEQATEKPVTTVKRHF
jgi:hypothetical protein